MPVSSAGGIRRWDRPPVFPPNEASATHKPDTDAFSVSTEGSIMMVRG